MLGLIQKDIYQMLKYQRVLILIVVIFAIASAKIKTMHSFWCTHR